MPIKFWHLEGNRGRRTPQTTKFRARPLQYSTASFSRTCDMSTHRHISLHIQFHSWNTTGKNEEKPQNNCHRRLVLSRFLYLSIGQRRRRENAQRKTEIDATAVRRDKGEVEWSGLRENGEFFRSQFIRQILSRFSLDKLVDQCSNEFGQTKVGSKSTLKVRTNECVCHLAGSIMMRLLCSSANSL